MRTIRPVESALRVSELTDVRDGARAGEGRALAGVDTEQPEVVEEIGAGLAAEARRVRLATLRRRDVFSKTFVTRRLQLTWHAPRDAKRKRRFSKALVFPCDDAPEFPGARFRRHSCSRCSVLPERGFGDASGEYRYVRTLAP